AAHRLREADLALRGRAEGEAARGGVLHRADDVGVRVAEDGGAPGADVIDVGAAVLPVDARALGAGDEDGLAADGAEGADGAVDAAGDDGARALEEVSGGGVAHGDPYSSPRRGRGRGGGRNGRRQALAAWMRFTSSGTALKRSATRP